MLCIICGRIFDPTPLWICRDCQKDMDRVNERVEMMYLLRESYQYVPAIWLRKRIEDVFQKEGKPL